MTENAPKRRSQLSVTLEAVDKLTEAHERFATTQTKNNVELKEIKTSLNEIRNYFVNGLDQKIINTLKSHSEVQNVALVDVVKTTSKNLFWKLAGSIAIIATLFAGIVQLIFWLNHVSGGVP